MRPLSDVNVPVPAEPFLEQLGIGLIDADFASQQVYFDEAALQFFGGDPEWMLGGVMFSRFLQQVHVDDRDCVRDCVRMIGPNSPSFVSEHRTYPDPTRTCWVLVRGRGYFDTDGVLLRIVGVVIDVTALKTDDRSYMSTVSSGERLNDLADLVIAARRLIDHLSLSDMRPLIDDLLMRVGMRLGAEVKSEARAALQ